MTVRFYTGLRIISSVLHQRVRAAVKRLRFGFVIVAGTRMSRFQKPDRVIFGLAFLAGGCLLGPDFKAPPTRVADKWLEHGNKSVDSTAAAEYRDWWTVFNDPRLTRLIQLAYQQNLTLRT